MPFRITFVQMTAMISETDGRFRKRHDLISESARSNSRNTPAVKENQTNVFPETHGLISGNARSDSRNARSENARSDSGIGTV